MLIKVSSDAAQDKELNSKPCIKSLTHIFLKVALTQIKLHKLVDLEDYASPSVKDWATALDNLNI